MEKKNKKLASITNSADYHQITTTSCITLSGRFLPIQIMYRGKANRCHPRFKSPPEFKSTQTENQWLHEEKGIEYSEQFSLPFVEKEKKELCLYSSKKRLLIDDILKENRLTKRRNLFRKSQ